MADEKDKGFRVIDRRGQEEAPPSAPPSPPPGETVPPPAPEGNRPPAPGVQGEKGRGEGRPQVGAPRFLDLVQSIQLGAMVSLGMVQGPDGKQPPANLPAAKDAIDILGILQEKTKGNLEEAEDRVLREGLYQLRMAYITVQKASIPNLGGGI